MIRLGTEAGAESRHSNEEETVEKTLVDKTVKDETVDTTTTSNTQSIPSQFACEFYSV